jgi:hypothetical protein
MNDREWQRFWAKVDIQADSQACWMWRSHTDGRGYGYFWMAGRSHCAHRVAFEDRKGPVPKGLEPDHLCRTPGCVNPNHLEAVTHLENMRRGERARKTHCKRGHPFDETNTRYRTDRPGARECRTCVNEAWARLKERRKQAAA